MWQCLIIFSVCFVSVFAGLGPCPTISDAKNFDVDRFIGTWYILADTMSYAGSAQCGKIYIDRLQGNTLNFTHTYTHVYSGTQYVTDGELIPMGSSKRIFDFKNKNNYKRHYWVVGTDYETWALLYVCSQSTISNSVSGFLLSRQNDQQCLSMLQKYVIKQAMLQVRGWKIISFGYHNQNVCHQ